MAKKGRDIDNAHQQFREKLKKKHARAERLRSLFQKSKSLLTKEVERKKGNEKEFVQSKLVQQKRQELNPGIGQLAPRPTPPNSYTHQKKQEAQERAYIPHRGFGKSPY